MPMPSRPIGWNKTGPKNPSIYTESEWDALRNCRLPITWVEPVRPNDPECKRFHLFTAHLIHGTDRGPDPLVDSVLYTGEYLECYWLQNAMFDAGSEQLGVIRVVPDHGYSIDPVPNATGPDAAIGDFIEWWCRDRNEVGIVVARYGEWLIVDPVRGQMEPVHESMARLCDAPPDWEYPTSQVVIERANELALV